MIENTLIKILNEFPDKKLDWNELSRNPNITIEYINSNLNKPWIWENIQENPNIMYKNKLVLEFIINNINKPWDKCRLVSTNPNISSYNLTDISRS